MRPSVYEPLERAPVSPPGPCGPDLPTWWGGKYPMNPTAIVDALGYPAAGLGILIESAGVPFPGEALLLAATTRPRRAGGLRLETEPPRPRRGGRVQLGGDNGQVGVTAGCCGM